MPSDAWQLISRMITRAENGAMLVGQEECLEFDPVLFTAFVERVVVSGTKKDVRLVLVLRDGSEL